MQIPPDSVIRFDTADVAWLSAYTHFLSAFSETALAFDPEPVVAPRDRQCRGGQGPVG